MRVRFGILLGALMALLPGFAFSQTNPLQQFSLALDSMESCVQRSASPEEIEHWKQEISKVIESATEKSTLLTLLSDTLEHKSRVMQKWSHRGLLPFAELLSSQLDLYPNLSTTSCRFDAWFQKGRCERFTGHTDEARVSLQNALELSFLTSAGYPSTETGNCYYHLGHATTMSGDSYEARRLYELAAHQYLEAEGPLSLSYSRANLIISGMYVNTGEFQKALRIGREVMASRLGNSEARARDLSSAAINLSSIFLALEELDSAWFQLQLAQAYLREGGEQSPMAWRDYHESCYNVQMARNAPALALSHADTALALTLEMGNEGTRDEAKFLVHRAEAHMGLARYPEAELCSQQALSILLNDYPDPSVLPQLPQLDPEEPWVQTALAVRGASLLRLSQQAAPDQERKLLLDALHHLRLACDQVDNLRRSFSSGGARLDLADATYDQYELGILTANRLHQLTGDTQYLAQVWEFMERSKAMALITELNSLTARESALPDSLQQLEQSLIDSILALEERERKAPAAQRSAIHAELLRQQQAQQAFILRMEEQFPTYHQIKYDVQLQSLDSLHRYLKHHQASLVEYFMSDTALYIFSTDGQQVKLRSLGNALPWRDQLVQYCNGISGLREFTGTAEALTLASGLHGQLLANDVAASKRVIVVPDGQLWSLPFEALATGPGTDFRTAPWLVLRQSVQYAYSSNYLLRLPSFKLEGNGQLLAYAPSFSGENQDRRGFGQLTHNTAEAKEVTSCTGGTLRLGRAASELHFREEAPRYTVLHIASHARMREGAPDSSGIAFQQEDDGSDGFLSVPELRTLRLNAELAVLSACETGDGRLVRGEGLMSLSRSFTHSGCRSLVMSLWSVDDEATSRIMQEFYRNLAQGKEKDEALRQAKLAYLVEGNPHPAKWAAFVSIGAPDSLQVERNSGGGLWWVLAGIGALVAFAAGWIPKNS